MGTPFLNKMVATPIFLTKGARIHKKRADDPLLSEKEVHAKLTVPKLPTKFSFGIGKYRENTNQYQPKIPNRYQTLVISRSLSSELLPQVV